MPKLGFSPLEQRTLSLLGSGYWTLREVQEHLASEASYQAVRAAVAYLRRNNLVAYADDVGRGELLERTELGGEVLAEYMRELERHNGRMGAIVNLSDRSKGP